MYIPQMIAQWSLFLSTYGIHEAQLPELIQKAEDIKKISTQDGQTLFFNVFVDSGSSEESVTFPYDISQLPAQKQASMLYEMSSLMPKNYHEEIMNFCVRVST